MCSTTEPFCLRFINWLKKLLLFVSSKCTINSFIKFVQVTSDLRDKIHQYYTNLLVSMQCITFVCVAHYVDQRATPSISIHVTRSLPLKFLILIFGIWLVLNPNLESLKSWFTFLLFSSWVPWNTLSPLGSISHSNFVKYSFKPSIYAFKASLKPSMSPFMFTFMFDLNYSSSLSIYLWFLFIALSLIILIYHVEGLMGVSFFLFGGILEPINDIYSSLCPLNHFKLILQTKFMKI